MTGREQRVLDALERGRRRPPKFDAERIDMSHGAGGKATHKLIEGLLLPAFADPALAPLSDAAVIPFADARLAITTDSFVVRPLSFPGGSIGELAVNGTVNDLAVSGATPLALSCAFIIEEGLETEVLRREVAAMADAAGRAGVSIATGDTKVVERGKGDGLYVITTGVGLADAGLDLSTAAVKPGDKIICSGTLGDHGTAILIARGDLDLEAEVLSDTRCLTPLVEALKSAAGPGLRFMRDPTRGGVGTVLNELARDSGLGVVLWEEKMPVREAVNGACEILGIDPLYVANEGKLLAVVSPETADTALEALRNVEGGKEAEIIGEVREEPARMVLMHTGFGGTRMIDMLVGDPLPRIC
ncbi:hydrogenase expression/formation protein HypE [Rubrobacter indicoceani]|uniref:hydrogenase expression/formation protein HypE n=1 Tax=Rubrobacter indicoceani TaxID=2051957 RepID=UPI000E5BF9E0|nr:hydrogenase expression/formation protein HypE [Rubrobacter indicoceani]